MLVLLNFNLDSKLVCWFSRISIWNPNLGVAFPAFQFGIQICVKRSFWNPQQKQTTNLQFITQYPSHTGQETLALIRKWMGHPDMDPEAMHPQHVAHVMNSTWA